MSIKIEDVRDPALRRQLRAALDISNRATMAALKPEASDPPRVSHESQSPLEAKFERLYGECGGPALTREICLVPGRKFRCDFYHEPSRTIIEMEGFRDHTSRKGFRRDGEKYFALTMLGFTVIRITGEILNEENVRKIIQFINNKAPLKRRKMRLVRE